MTPKMAKNTKNAKKAPSESGPKVQNAKKTRKSDLRNEKSNFGLVYLAYSLDFQLVLVTESRFSLKWKNQKLDDS